MLYGPATDICPHDFWHTPTHPLASTLGCSTIRQPASVGRNMDEIERVVDALILSSDKSIATPANWPNNHEEAGMKVRGRV